MNYTNRKCETCGTIFLINRTQRFKHQYRCNDCVKNKKFKEAELSVPEKGAINEFRHDALRRLLHRPTTHR